MWWVLFTIGIIILIMILYGYFSHFRVVVTEYNLYTDKVGSERIFVILSDLHSCRHDLRFDKNDPVSAHQKLLSYIDDIGPDAVMIPGDLTVKKADIYDKRTVISLALLKELRYRGYDVYYSPGNHEIRMASYDKYKSVVRGYGVHYLENDTVNAYDDITVSGLDIPIERYRIHKPLSYDELISYIPDISDESDEKKPYHILLAHVPGFFDAYMAGGYDLVLSGHLHGGWARLPIVGGVMGSAFRPFPKYDAGDFESDKKHMIVSRGLGSHSIKLRWFNPPELVVVHIKPEKG